MNENNSTLIIVGSFVAIVIGFAAFLSLTDDSGKTLEGQDTPKQDYTAFVTCLKEKGAVFYGAFWCPHCQSQKKLFGDSAKNLPYVECSSPDQRSQTAVCKEKKIESYPTWMFADGSILKAEVSLAQLSEKTSCVLPGETSVSVVDIQASTSPVDSNEDLKTPSGSSTLSQ